MPLLRHGVDPGRHCQLALPVFAHPGYVAVQVADAVGALNSSARPGSGPARSLTPSQRITPGCLPKPAGRSPARPRAPVFRQAAWPTAAGVTPAAPTASSTPQEFPLFSPLPSAARVAGGDRPRVDPRSGVGLDVLVGVSLQPDARTDPLFPLTPQVSPPVGTGWLCCDRPCLVSGLSPGAGIPYQGGRW